MSKFCIPKEVKQVTVGGELVVSLEELGFLYELTGESSAPQAVEKFACVCMNYYKDPQEVLKAIDIQPFPVYHPEEGVMQPDEPTYQRVRYELIKRKADDNKNA